MMDQRVEQKVRERAYQIWVEAGRLNGLDLEHWTKAERDVATNKAVALTPAAGASATKPIAKVAKPATKSVATTKQAKSVKASPDAAKSPRRTKASTTEARGTLN